MQRATGNCDSVAWLGWLAGGLVGWAGRLAAWPVGWLAGRLAGWGILGGLLWGILGGIISSNSSSIDRNIYISIIFLNCAHYIEISRS